MIWWDQPRYNKHVWAFIHFCRRQGDEVDVRIHSDGERMDVRVKK